MENSILLEKAIALIDVANAQDPNTIIVEGVSYPNELIYGQRMSAALQEFYPDASLALRLAARAHHICRWQISRSDYPAGKTGYYAWRNKLKKFHAEKAGKISSEVGLDEEVVDRIQYLIQKKNLNSDAETQILEDVICIVFLQFYFEEFAGKHIREKVIDIVQKTWSKMSKKGQDAALQLELSPTSIGLINAALA